MDYDGYWSNNPYYGGYYGYGDGTGYYGYDDPDGWWFRRRSFFPFFPFFSPFFFPFFPFFFI
jgi:hypothetical protein